MSSPTVCWPSGSAEIYLDTEEIYGAPRIYSELKLGDGIQIGKNGLPG